MNIYMLKVLMHTVDLLVKKQRILNLTHWFQE
nr:MAG TPA: hypothetical protein [Caudoviricetes sp.]